MAEIRNIAQLSERYSALMQHFISGGEKAEDIDFIVPYWRANRERFQFYHWRRECQEVNGAEFKRAAMRVDVAIEKIPGEVDRAGATLCRLVFSANKPDSFMVQMQQKLKPEHFDAYYGVQLKELPPLTDAELLQMQNTGGELLPEPDHFGDFLRKTGYAPPSEARLGLEQDQSDPSAQVTPRASNASDDPSKTDDTSDWPTK